MKKKLDYERIKELHSQNLSCEKIAPILGCSIDGVYNAVRNMGLTREFKLCESIPKEFSKLQKSVLTGALLGDSSIRHGVKNPSVKFENGIKQKEYLLWKYEFFKEFASIPVHNIRKPDKRTGNIYESYSFRLHSNPELIFFYKNLHIDGKKRITKEFLENYDEMSLAVHIMDDGSKLIKSILLHTQCFSVEDVKMFQGFLYERFNIVTTINMNRGLPVIRTATSSFDLIKFLVKDYIIESMKYKVS